MLSCSIVSMNCLIHVLSCLIYLLNYVLSYICLHILAYCVYIFIFFYILGFRVCWDSAWSQSSWSGTAAPSPAETPSKSERTYSAVEKSRRAEHRARDLDAKYQGKVPPSIDGMPGACQDMPWPTQDVIQENLGPYQ